MIANGHHESLNRTNAEASIPPVIDLTSIQGNRQFMERRTSSNKRLSGGASEQLTSPKWSGRLLVRIKTSVKVSLFTQKTKPYFSLQTMSVPSGLYEIAPAFLVQPSPAIGADTNANSDVGAGIHVVFDGTDRVWEVKRQGDTDKYLLTLRGGWHSVPAGPDVMVNVTIPIGALWRLEKIPGTDFYLIVLDNELLPRLCWTLSHANPKARVVLEPIKENHEGQEWWFRPIEE